MGILVELMPKYIMASAQKHANLCHNSSMQCFVWILPTVYVNMVIISLLIGVNCSIAIVKHIVPALHSHLDIEYEYMALYLLLIIVILLLFYVLIKFSLFSILRMDTASINCSLVICEHSCITGRGCICRHGYKLLADLSSCLGNEILFNWYVRNTIFIF